MVRWLSNHRFLVMITPLLAPPGQRWRDRNIGLVQAQDHDKKSARCQTKRATSHDARLLRSHLLMIRNSLLDASRHMSAAGSCQIFSRTWTCSALHDTPGTWSTDRATESSPRVTRQRPSSGNRALLNVNGGGWPTVLGWVCLRSIWNRTTIHWVSLGGKHPSSRWVASRKFLWCGQSNASGICFRRWR